MSFSLKKPFTWIALFYNVCLFGLSWFKWPYCSTFQQSEFVQSVQLLCWWVSKSTTSDILNISVFCCVSLRMCMDTITYIPFVIVFLKEFNQQFVVLTTFSSSPTWCCSMWLFLLSTASYTLLQNRHLYFHSPLTWKCHCEMLTSPWQPSTSRVAALDRRYCSFALSAAFCALNSFSCVSCMLLTILCTSSSGTFVWRSCSISDKYLWDVLTISSAFAW